MSAGDVSGSSPRLQGALCHNVRPTSSKGIIPALAGSTLIAIVSKPSTRDHPRACGEHHRRHHQGDQAGGSSPRLRGAPRKWILQRPVGGIIPALAGSTRECAGTLRRRGDHPRACGEHYSITIRNKPVRGSSPRLRGARFVHYPASFLDGIIPALAGSTQTKTFDPWRRRDHPRACGEHLSSSVSRLGLVGSSPRLRGALAV